MIVRDAKPEDFDDLLRMGREFTRAAGQIDVDPISLDATLRNLIEGGILKVAVNGSVIGAAGALVYPHYWNSDELVAQELFFWVDQSHRGTKAAVLLIDALEHEAKMRGAEKMTMLCLEALQPQKVERLYLRLGYAPQERTFVKSL